MINYGIDKRKKMCYNRRVEKMTAKKQREKRVPKKCFVLYFVACARVRKKTSFFL